MPHAPMYGLVVQEHFNDLVIGTYGRGFWILDDVTPLQQLTAEVAAAPVHLFAPRPAYRFRPVSEPFAMFDDQSDGENPPYGGAEQGGAALVRTLEVRKDPHSEGTLADIRSQQTMLEAIRADYETAAGLVNRVEWVRRQLRDAKAVLEDRGDEATFPRRTSKARSTPSCRSA